MAVIINEFEVIAEPQPESQHAGAEKSMLQHPAPPAAQDVHRIVRHQLERIARIRAH